MQRKKIEANSKAIGPYSPALLVGNSLFVSGQLPIENGNLILNDIEKAARLSLENVKALAESAGFKMKDAVKIGIFLRNIEDFSKVNDVYASYFEEPYPARSTIEVSRLPKDSPIEIEAIFSK